MSELQQIKKNLETCGMLLIGEQEVDWLINKIEDLIKEKEEYRLEICRLYDKYCR